MALFVGMESVLGGERAPNFMSLVILVGLGLGLNGLYAGLLWSKYFPHALAIVAAVIDVILAIALMVMLSRHSQLLLPLMIFPPILAGVRWNTEAGLLAALPIALSYGVPIMPLLGDDIDRTRLTTGLLISVANALVLFIAGGLPGPFIRQHIDLAEAANKAEL